MKISRLILLSITLLLFFGESFSQLRGQILKAGDGTIDPNGDGFVSLTTAGFSNDGYYVDEFELKMFGIPIYEDGEVLNDIQAGALCGTTDLAVDTTGYSVYGVLDNGNLIFRFRLAGDKPSVEAYTILIDTDNKIGSEDPNWDPLNPENPGFEIDITFVKRPNAGVYIYNIDGIDFCPNPLASFPYQTNYQKSVAGTNSCDDPDYFYDFYIPFSSLTTLFGLTTKSELRFASVTNVSATCAMAGMISDIGGVNDANYLTNADAFLDLTTNQCPTAIEDLCQTCSGFKSGKTPKPSINTPVKVGESMITGTAVKNADIFVNRYDVNSTLIEALTSNSGTTGTWEVTFSTALMLGDSITARALLEGQCSSGISDSDLSFALVIVNTPPTLTATTSALTYTENDPAIKLLTDLVITDPDDTVMDEAWVTFTANYLPGEDVITLPPGQGLTLIADPATGEVHITGIASLAVYQSVINGIRYSNSSENPSTATRTFTVKVFDGLDESNILTRDILVVNVNDPPVIAGTAGQLTFFEGDIDIVIDNGIVLSDLDHTDLVGATVSISTNYISTEDLLLFTDQNGITGSFDAGTGVLTLSGTSTLSNYQTALQSVKYANTASSDPVLLVNPLTRQISFQVNDGIDLSNIHTRGIDMASTNSPPVVVDSGGTPIDTLWVSTNEDTPVYVCLDVIDPDGDAVDINTVSLKFGVGVLDVDPLNSLCFTFTPDLNFNGFEYADISVCDEATPPLCDNVIVAIEVIPVNDLPQIVDSGGNPLDTLYFETNEDESIDICLDAVDVENDPLELASGISLGMNSTIDIYDPNNLCFTYTPNLNYNGSDLLDLVVCEVGSTTQCDTLVAVATVVPVNDPPEITFGGVPVDTLYFNVTEDVVAKLCVEVDDVDGDFVQVTDAYPNAGYGGAYEPLPLGDLCFFFVGDPDENGITYGQVVVCDNQNPALCDTVVVEINIMPVNDPPDIISTDLSIDTLRLVTDEDTPLNFCFTIKDPDIGSQEDVSLISSTNLGSYSPGTGTGECFLFTPNLNIFGIEYATIRVCDNGSPQLCDLAIVEIIINSVNDAPVAVADSFSIPRNTAVSISGNLINNDYDIDGDLLVVNPQPENPPLHGSLVLNPDGSFTYTLFGTYDGSDSFVYTVCDDAPESLCASALVTLDVEIEIVPYQGLSPNGDGLNDYWRIDGIELFPNNYIRIFDRYNNLVFQTSSYNNQDRVWYGQSNEGITNNSVPEGSYFYMINLGDGSKPLSGYIILKKE